MCAWNALQIVAKGLAILLFPTYRSQTRPSNPATIKPRNPLLHLPVEVILHALSFLPGESVISFCLTCKAFKGTLFTSQQHFLAESETKRQFLYLLENDLLKHIHCSSCNKLYRWDKRSQFHYGCPNRYQPSNPGSHPYSTRLCTGHRFWSLDI